jgi:hypothetical protein
MTDLASAPRRYAIWLQWGTRIGLALLVAAFIAYVAGFVAAHVPIERTAAMWSQPAAAMVEATGLRATWAWAGHLGRSDMLALAAIALLASCSIACVAAVIPVFARHRERVLVGICVQQVAVLLLAASGLLTAGH